MYCYLVLLDLDRELAGLSLVVPSLDPVNRAQRSEGLPEDLTWLEVLTLDSDTLVVVDVVLSAVLGLVDVRESWVELGSVELEGFDIEGRRHG